MIPRALFALLACGWIASASAADPGGEAAAGARDPREERAEELLALPSGYPEAIALLRAVLEDRPDARSARLWLARVLSWNEAHAEALAEYDQLIAEDRSDRELLLERADVLSWAGRYSEAEAEFQARLAQDPEDAHASLGLAHVYQWSGRLAEADRAYQRALARAENAEARAAWEEMRATRPQDATFNLESFADSDGFTRLDVKSRYLQAVGWTSRAHVELAEIRIEGAEDPAGSGRDDDRAHQLRAGATRAFGEALEVAAGLGVRDWKRGADHWLGSLGATLTLSDRTAFDTELAHGDFIDSSQSLASLQQDVRDTRLHLGVWHDLSRGIDAYARLTGSDLSDGNFATSLDVSLGARPASHPELRAFLEAGWLSYRDRSTFYYAPERDLLALLGGEGSWALRSNLRFELNLGVGIGSSRVLGSDEVGLIWNGKSALLLTRGAWRGGLRFAWNVSQRDSNYRGTRAVLELGRAF